MPTAAPPEAIARRPRGFVRVTGPDAEAFLQRMVSNDVAALRPGDSCEALLLTPKARVVATMTVARRGPDDFLLLTEPELEEPLRSGLLRARFAAKVEVAAEEHSSYLLLGAPPEEGALAVPNRDYGLPAHEVLDAEPPPLPELAAERLEELRIRAGTPRYGHEIDGRVLPAEAGLVERAVSFTKGCFPGQEPIARLHYRGHANRGLRRIALDGSRSVDPGAAILFGEKDVGRVTSSVRAGEETLALAYVRAEVPLDAVLSVGDGSARQLA
jgi:folate-binding protein YgfZ